MFLEGKTIGFNGFSMVFEMLRAMVNDGLEVNNELQWFVCAIAQKSSLNIKDNCQLQVRLHYKRALSRLKMVILTTRKFHSFKRTL